MSATGTEPVERAGEPRTQPGWMTVLAVVCAATFVVIVLRDLFVPAARAVEVWFGLEITGWPALATAPLHWAIFAAGAWAFWTGRRGAVPWAAAYLVYAALSHLVWSEASPHGRGWPIGLVEAAAISGMAYLLWCLRALESAAR
jgi:hypothetical protein